MARIGRASIGRGLAAKVMGVINVSPESFYKGSVRTTDQEIAAAAREMQQDGAHIIDVGGESTRPGAQPVPLDQELSRVLPANLITGEHAGIFVNTGDRGVRCPPRDTCH